MKVLGIIPARGGSKGVIGKNIKPLDGKPLIAYTIEAASASKLAEVIVSTDDPKIAEIVRSYGGKAPFLRPAALATDSARAIPVIQHALREMEKEGDLQYDAVMMLQPTTPFRRTQDIDEALRILEEHSCDSVISVKNVDGYHPARMKFLENGRLLDPEFCETYENQPRQELRPMYIRNGAIYLTRRSVLLNGSFKGTDCYAQIMPAERSVNIDTEMDFKYAEWLKHEIL